MMDLIDRKSLLIQIEISPQKAFIRNTPLATDLRKLYSNVIKLAPTVDALPVVRCKHCKHRGFDECPMRHKEWYDYDDGEYLEMGFRVYDYTEDNGFCHKGEFEDGD